MCDIHIEGRVGIVDLSKCPFEFASPEFINYHLKNLVALDTPLKKLRYEEEIIFELDEKKTKILTTYAHVLSQIESILLNKDVYGHPSDPNYVKRKALLRKFYTYAYMNPISAARLLEEYSEPTPEKSLFMKGYQKFLGWIAGILKTFKSTQLYKLVEKTGDLRNAFLSLIGIQSLYFVNLIKLELPKDAKPIDDPKGHYTLPYGVEVQIYEVESTGMQIYTIRNTYLENIDPRMKKIMKALIDREMKENFINADYSILFNLKVNEYKQYFMEQALTNDIPLTPHQALGMAREAASWVVGLGAPIENIALDNENVTDVYIDSENSPIYIEHREFGVLHTLYRYNREILERVFKNIVLSEKGKKFDENNPVVDVVVSRISMRCHLQRPPATFNELQGAMRILSEEPFTYAQYLYYKSMSPFFLGYDDVMVTLGTSEAVLGLKGVGKTSFTAAKITSMGKKKRIIAIQDIEEIPVRTFRKRGFHIGAARVTSLDQNVISGFTKRGATLDLVTMTNALLRMGDAAVIINEVRSRSAVQGIINLLNTQPGVFLLYNLHSESLDDVRDRLELVFGIPSASMFATDRYTFLRKIKFGRFGKIYRVLGYEYESDKKNKKFVKIFEMKRGKNIESTTYEALFLNNKEASSNDLSNIDLKKMEKSLDIKFVPPALARRSVSTGISPEAYILQAFYKGMIYSDVYNAYKKTNVKELLGLDFMVEVNKTANDILKKLENENGEVDFGEAQRMWKATFPKISKSFISIISSGGKKKAK